MRATIGVGSSWLAKTFPSSGVSRTPRADGQKNDRQPVFLNAADPPREVKLWLKKAPLRLTRLEREYWKASRAERARTHREKRLQRQALIVAERQQRMAAEEAIRARKDASRQISLRSGLGGLAQRARGLSLRSQRDFAVQGDVAVAPCRSSFTGCRSNSGPRQCRTRGSGVIHV